MSLMPEQALLPLAMRCTLVCAALYGAYKLACFARADADLTTLAARKKRLDGKVVVVTGASSGIGEEMAKQLSALGAYVVLAARREEELRRVQSECAVPEKTLTIQLDLTKCETHQSVVETLLAKVRLQWGCEGVDVLVNNGGRSQRALIEEELDNVEAERTLMEVNYFGTVSFTKQVLRLAMLPRKSGRICFVTSVAGKLGAPVSAGYSAAKHAVQGWADTLRHEVRASGISVLNICPGPVATALERSTIRGKQGKEPADSAGKMPVENAVDRMLRAMCTDSVLESWVSPHPVLLFLYLGLYFPGLTHKISEGPVNNRITSYRTGVSLYKAGLLESLKGIFSKKKEKTD